MLAAPNGRYSNAATLEEFRTHDLENVYIPAQMRFVSVILTKERRLQDHRMIADTKMEPSSHLEKVWVCISRKI